MRTFALAALAATGFASQAEFFRNTSEGYGHYQHHAPVSREVFSLEELGKKVDVMEKAIHDSLKTCKLETNYFSANPQLLSVNINTPFTIEPKEICVDKGNTVEIAVQGSFDSPADTVVGYQIVETSGKYKKVVAEGRFTDAQDPSSVSVFYRETVDKDSSFEIQFIGINTSTNNKLVVTNNSFSIEEGNVQVGIKIFSKGCHLQSDMPKECKGVTTPYYHKPSHNHGHGSYGSHGYGGYRH